MNPVQSSAKPHAVPLNFSDPTFTPAEIQRLSEQFESQLLPYFSPDARARLRAHYVRESEASDAAFLASGGEEASIDE